MNTRRNIARAVLATASLGLCTAAFAGDFDTVYDQPMLEGLEGWTSTPLFTVGETIEGYTPVGILDGIGAFPWGRDTVRVLVNAELTSGAGYAYPLKDGTGGTYSVTGARVHYFDVHRDTRRICGAGVAYDTVYDRTGTVADAASDVNEAGHATRGFDRFCSSQAVLDGTYGFRDDVYFTNEETGTPGHAHGGSIWALDPHGRAIWAAPALGRGGWENVTPLDTESGDFVALLLGDDTTGAPLYLWLGEKGRRSSDFLDRNGLSRGTLHAWVADPVRGARPRTPADFHGQGEKRKGRFLPIATRDPSKAGTAGYDGFGWKDDATLRSDATRDASLGGLEAFQFARPEDLATNPRKGRQAVFVTTGAGGTYPDDNWGMVFRVDVEFRKLRKKPDIRATLRVLYDRNGDDAAADAGLRNPDNLDWADDGFVYVSEDRSTTPSSLFGSISGREASLWRFDPKAGGILRIGEMDRSAVAPAGTTDSAPADRGNWESSGVLDVSDLFDTDECETLLIADVQAHSLTNGPIAAQSLVQGGQLLLLSKKDERRGRCDDEDVDCDDDHDD
jgi:secreted PhoX family phosphatase